VRMVRNDLTVWELHYKPAFDPIQQPEFIVTAKQVVTAFSKLFFFDSSQNRSHF
jgi:hypothetical protein